MRLLFDEVQSKQKIKKINWEQSYHHHHHRDEMMRSIWRHTKNNQTLYDSQNNDESPVSEFWNHKRSNLQVLPLERRQSMSKWKVLKTQKKKILYCCLQIEKFGGNFWVNLLKSLNIARRIDLHSAERRNFFTKKFPMKLQTKQKTLLDWHQ